MGDITHTMMGLIVTSLRAANGLLRAGHKSFWPFALAQRPDGTRLCIASNEADFAPLLALLSGTVGVLSENTEPSTEAVCLAADGEDDNEESGAEAVVARLQRLAADGEVVASAVVEIEPDWDNPAGVVPTVWVKLEHKDDWTLLYTQAYSMEGGAFRAGEVGTFEHEAEVFVR